MSIEAMKTAYAAMTTGEKFGDAIDALHTAIQQAEAQATQTEVTDGIRPEDFTVDVVVKSMGGFAQINTKGVRVTHKPTGISVMCDVARSQHANRNQAIETLRAILALRTERVPMTDEKVSEMWVRFSGQSKRAAGQFVRAVEAHHGITAQPKGGE